MKLKRTVVERIARETADNICEAVEATLAYELEEDRWESVTMQLEADLAELITDVFEEA